MDVHTETIDAIRVTYFRGVGPYQQSLPPTWAKMRAYAAARGLFTPSALVLTIAHDNPRTTPPEQIRGDACVSVGDDFEPDGEAAVQTIPAGLYAVARYVGPYAGLAAAWGSFACTWSREHGYGPRSAPSFEVYRTNPATTPADQNVTDLYEPIQPV